MLPTHDIVARLQKDWTSRIYAFYDPKVTIHYDKNGKYAHVFHCTNCGCKATIKRWQDTGDKGSTSNLQKHIIKCWGKDALDCATDSSSLKKAREGVKTYARSGDLTASFERAGKGKVSYSVRQHTPTETR